jgi:hypothetical protein
MTRECARDTISASPLDLVEVRAEEGEPESEVRVSDAVALVLRCRLGRERLVDGDDTRGHEGRQGSVERALRDVRRATEGDLVEDGDTAVIGEGGRQQAQCSVPAGQLDTTEELSSGQVRGGDLLREQGQLVPYRSP